MSVGVPEPDVSVALCSYAVDYNMTLKWLGKRANNAAMQPSYSATCARLHYVLVLCLSVSQSVRPSVACAIELKAKIHCTSFPATSS